MGPIIFDSVVDLVDGSSSATRNPDDPVSEEVLESIREMERLVGITDDVLPDECNCLSDARIFDGAHWGDDCSSSNPLDQDPPIDSPRASVAKVEQ